MMGDTVVVIEDEREILDLLQAILEGEGYRVVSVGHPTLLHPAIADYHPALFLIDIMLPGVSGIALAERLHSGGYGRVPRVAMSASDAMVLRAAHSGWFAGVLEKPFDVERLVACVAEHLAA